MAAADSSRLGGLRLVDPQDGDGWTHLRVPATAPAPLPRALGPLEVEVAGAGRTWSLAGWLEATH
ncbi:MAG: hypothetical protein HOQ22_00045, partial [Nocardioidaceae bacterium]|nr:hypothetical protein [Nocardioidaceae bacterium]